MFVDIISSDYDLDLFDDFAKTVGAFNNHNVRVINEDFACRKVIQFSHNKTLKSLCNRDIKPMMTSCSASYKENPDGSWELSTRIEFANNELNDDKSNENCNDGPSSQETAANNSNAPDSQDHG